MRDTLIRTITAFLAIALLGTLAYLPSLYVPFLYDDLWEIVGNRALEQLTDLSTILRYNPARPLLMLSFALDRALFGLDVFWYHVENLLLHLVNGLCVFWLSLRLLRTHAAPATPEGSTPEDDAFPQGFGLALGLALLFVLHPVAVEAVTYVASRSSSLTATFYLLGVLAWIRFRDAQGAGEKSWVWLGLTLNAYLLAILTKEEGVSLPAVLLAYDLLLAPTKKTGDLRRWWAPQVALWGLLGAVLVARLALYGTLMPPVVVRSVGTQVLTGLEVMWAYLRLWGMPSGLSLYHDYPVVTSIFSVKLLLAGVGHIAVVVASVRLRKSFPMLGFAALWYYAVLSPTTSIIPLKEVMAEHRLYLALVGPLLLLGVGVARLSARLRLPPLGLLLPLAVGLGLMTFQVNRLWQDDVALWARAAQLSPQSGDAAYALGDAWKRRGKLAEAQGSYEEAIRRYEALKVDLSRYSYNYVDALHNLGVVHGQQGRLDQALVWLNRALMANPRHVPSWTSLGYARMQKGLNQEAAWAFEQALLLDPDAWLAHFHLAGLFAGPLNDTGQAAWHLKRCLELAPNHPLAGSLRQRLIELGHGL